MKRGEEGKTYMVALLPCSAGAEAEAGPDGPRAAPEDEERKDDAEGEADAGFDDEGGETAIPLRRAKGND